MEAGQPSDDAPNAAGFSMSDLVGLPDDQRQLLNWMLRQGDVTLADVAQHLVQEVDGASRLLTELESKGYVQELDDDAQPRHYRTQRAQKPNRPRLASNLWRALDS